MDAEQIRKILLDFPHVAETMQWGANLVFWVGDKAIGGKMFALVNLDGDGRAIISYCAGPERYAELLEREGILPAPYLARAYWVAVERWDVFRSAEWKSELTAAHEIVRAKLPKRVQQVLALPSKERQHLIRQGKALRSKQTGRGR
jgi:predicted DNA-binding protein (MmcQ/YjbR family)